MSLNQSRSEKSDSQFRKPGGGGRGSGSGGQYRNFSGGRGRGGGPGPTSNPAAPTIARSYKKVNNAQVGQSRANPGTVNVLDLNTASAASLVENSGYSQSNSHGVSSTPSSVTTAKPADAPPQKTSRPIPRAPSSHSSSTNSDPPLPPKPSKGDGAIQFGSISPGFMNGMQVPPRTSSAPPKLDEQQRDQARRDSSRALPAIPSSSVLKQDLPKKAVVLSGKSVTQQTHTESKVQKPVQVASGSQPTQAQKPFLPVAGVSLPTQFHQPSVSVPFGGPNPQIQSQSIPGSVRHPTPQLPLQMGNPSQVPQQVFVPGLQHPLMQTQGIIHHGQNLGYSPQIPHQMGNMGLNISSQFSKQPAATFGGSQFGSGRKTVKITHPDTHEELRLDVRDGGSSVSRSHHSAQQTQPPTYNAAHPVGYYSSSYATCPPFFPVPSSLPTTSAPSNAISKGIRISYPVSQEQSNISVANQLASKSFSAGNSGTSVQGIRDSLNPVNVRDVQDISRPAQRSSTSVTVRAAGDKAISTKAVENIDHSRFANSVEKDSEIIFQASNGFKSENQSTSVPPTSVTVASAPTALPNVPKTSSRDLVSTQHVDAIDNVAVPSVAGSIQKQQDERGHLQIVQKADGQSDSNLHQDLDDSSKAAASEHKEAEIICTSSEPKDSESEAVCVSSTVNKAAHGDAAAVHVYCGNLAVSSESCDRQSVVNKSGEHQQGKHNSMHLQENVKKASTIIQESGGDDCHGGLLVNVSLKVLDATDGAEKIECSEGAGLVSNAVIASQRGEADSLKSSTESDNMQSKSLSCVNGSDVLSSGCGISDLKTSATVTDGLKGEEYDASRSKMSDNEVLPPAHMPQVNAVVDNEAVGNPRPSSSAGSVSVSSTAALESSKTKNRGKKKWKEVLQMADAQGTSDDLYNAYRGPEENKETFATSEVSVEAKSKEASTDSELESTVEEKDELSKAELDDWEDAADVLTPKLESSGKDGVRFLHDDEGVATKKYHRDFLLTFSEHCTYLPEGFNVSPDMVDSLLRSNVVSPRSGRDYTSSGRVVDRPGGFARFDRRNSGNMDAERWNKQSGPCPPAPDPRLDLAYGSNVMGFAGNRGPTHGVLRNPRTQQGHVQISGGILSGPTHSLSFQGLQRNSSDDDRWQRGSNFHKGLMPVPLTSAPPMHKAERKYEVGKVTDEEQAKQRKLKGILNKLTPQNFEKLFDQVQQLNIDNVTTLTGVISQIFDKALMEPTFCEMYATFCAKLALGLPDLIVDNEKITFRRLLLNKCQEEFERGEREEQEANNAADGEGDTCLSEAEREEKRIKVRRRMLGNIRLIGELYKQRMLTERIMHECIKKLLGQDQNPDEENIEALCKLMSTIGESIDHSRAKEHMDAYFHIMSQLSNNMKLSSRVRFMLKDSIDLRKNKWQQRRKVEGPKKIKEVHDDAQQERHGQGGRLSRGPSMNSSMRRGPQDFGSRGSMLSSPIGAGVGIRGMPPQVSMYGQEVRIDERNIFENRTFSVPLPQRSSPDEPITLGPQGGLARGMAFRGQPSFSGSPQLDNSQSYGDSRRMGGVNGYGTAPERVVYSSREDQYGRNTSDRFGPSAARDQSSREELISSSTNRELRYSDRNVDKSRPLTPPMPRTGAALTQNNSSEKLWPEERLRDMSVAAIREYYSAKDEQEVALCLKELNAPSYYPTVVSIWVSDSFERRDLERDLLSKLLVNLTRPGVGTFNQSQLMQGFESVLNNLEDTVTDAPRAPEFLGRIFAKAVMENVLPLSELGRLIQHGGEEPGRLLEVGLAAEVLGNVLERIKSEKGLSTLNEIRASSNLKLLDFRPPNPAKCAKLEMFM